MPALSKAERGALSSDRLRREIREHTLRPEPECLAALVETLALAPSDRERIGEDAANLVAGVRERGETGLMQQFLSEYGLSSDEGVALMCLAEAFLRTPDAASLDELISDKIGGADWARHLGRAESALVNASTWALMLTGRVFRSIPARSDDLAALMRGLVRRLGEPVARIAVGEAMKLLGRQFVLGSSIEEAIENGAEDRRRGNLHSFDMLGEAARTARDAARYFAAYAGAIAAAGRIARPGDPHENSGVSVKLSALYPRYETAKRARVMAELEPALAELVRMARAANIPLAIDAEEADRLDLSLDIIESILSLPVLAGWPGFGVVVQTYSRRAPRVLDWLAATCARLDRSISVRLVKGAYWDSEIKWAQQKGLASYPVFTRKEATDVSYLACARQLFGFGPRIFPQFATHNAHTLAAVRHMAPDGARYEFQRLHGMGETLHELGNAQDGIRRRIYAPVGVHKDLLAYLVRRLLENGANSSFVHQLLDRSVAISEIVADPLERLERAGFSPHPRIPSPRRLFADRANSAGRNLADPAELEALAGAMAGFAARRWGPPSGRPVFNPARRDELVGHVVDAVPADAAKAITIAEAGFPQWSAMPAMERAALLDAAADAYEANAAELMALAVREAGKTLPDAESEVREAVDFLRYYAARARDSLEGRTALGVVVCISPWNFPLAIFTGQIAGALAAGNTVVAKPAEQTPLMALRAVGLLRQAGIPGSALQLVHGDGARIGPVLCGDARIAGFVFTGSAETARKIEISLARDGNHAAVLHAETGGINAMLVDSTALAEQAVRDILSSAFQSAGQRCSALRVLFVQRDIAAPVLEMLSGAARELAVGDPWDAATDVGPIIDEAARQDIARHCAQLEKEGRLLFKTPMARDLPGSFLAPQAFRLDSLAQLEREVFGPVLHVVTYDASDLDEVVAAINRSGYGLTLGIHSRIDTRVDRICAQAQVGNIYVNRNQIGAVVGVQPFGGENLSGTGPKAGGPAYLLRLSRPRGTNNGGAGTEAPASPVELPGPTGERNTLGYHPRGLVACLGPDETSRSKQAEAARAAGNTVLECEYSGAAFSQALAEGSLAAVLWQGEPPRDLRLMLAESRGRRVPILELPGDAFLLSTERCVSEDTTAAGGNASLLAIAT